MKRDNSKPLIDSMELKTDGLYRARARRSPNRQWRPLASYGDLKCDLAIFLATGPSISIENMQVL